MVLFSHENLERFNIAMTDAIHQSPPFELVIPPLHLKPYLFHANTLAVGELNCSHHHSTLEVTLIAAGRLGYCIGAEKIELNPGDVFFVPAGVDHHWVPLSDGIVPIGFHLEIYPDHRSHSMLQRRLAELASQHHYHLPAFAAFERTVREICEGFWAGRADNVSVLRLLMSDALLAFLKRFPELLDPGELPRNSGAEANLRLVQEVRDYIAPNLGSPLHVTGLAARFGVSERHLNRIFQAIENVTLGQYIIDRRIHQACKMLMDRNIMVKEVAIETGFNDLNYFCKVFRKKIGMSPGLYRRSIGLRNFRNITSPLSPEEEGYLTQV